MADEENERAGSLEADLNRRISSTLVSRRRRQDFESNSSGSLVWNPSTEEVNDFLEAFPTMDSLNSRSTYSPSNLLFAPESPLVDPFPGPTEIPDSEYVSYLPRDSQDVASSGPDGSAVANRDEALAGGSGSVVSQGPLNSRGLSDRPFLLESNDHMRLPHFTSPSSDPYHQSETGVNPFISLAELIMNDTDPSTQQTHDFVEYRFQRLIQLYESQRPNYSGGAPSDSLLTSPDRLMHNIIQSGRCLAARRNARNLKGKDPNGSNKLEEDSDDAALNFECNICFELAKDPVVTPCGHLFCWPCLYQWLFAHSRYSECPVCKGEVLEVNVTPIYGHGGTYSSAGKQCVDGKPNLKIPPRPRASRVENIREQLEMSILRQGEANTNRRQVTGDMITFSTALLSRLIGRMPNQEAGQSNPRGVALPGNMTSIPQPDPGRPFSSLEAPSRVIERATSLSAAEQTSNSSTMAVIQDDSVTTETSAGPSWPVATRTRSRRVRNSSGSQGIYESEQEHIRRRLQ